MSSIEQKLVQDGMPKRISLIVQQHLTSFQISSLHFLYIYDMWAAVEETSGAHGSNAVHQKGSTTLDSLD